MRYASIRELDISNGEGVGCSLFVQGCPDPHCYNCFNPDTWDFDGGKEWNQEIKQKFMDLINRPYIKRISILGGEPIARQNIDDVTLLLQECKNTYPNKKIWLWSGFDFETYISKLEVIKYLDYVIDGKYIDNLKDMTLKWRGSSNQHIWMKKENRWIVYE